jgi:DNA mismatch repair protein MutS
MRVITPGTLTDEALLDSRAQNLIAAVFCDEQNIGLAWLELSAGRFCVSEPESLVALDAELARLVPAELLVEEGLQESGDLEFRKGTYSLPPWHFEADSARRILCSQFGTRDLSGFGCEQLDHAVCAAGALLQYVQDTQRGHLPHLTGLTVENRSDALLMDAATRRNLELDTSLAGRPEHTLAGILDRCTTPMGSRLLHRWINRPLRDHAILEQRFEALSQLGTSIADELRPELNASGDLERILARIGLGSARPKDLAQLRNALRRVPVIKTILGRTSGDLLGELAVQLGDHTETLERLEAAIIEDPPMLIRDGGVIATGYDAELDELRELSTNANSFLSELEQRERERTGLASLKVGYNRVHGYYIEISKVQSERAPEEYVRRQTLKGAERYITPELKTFEDQVLSARERSLAREKHLYEDLLTSHLAVLEGLQAMAAAVAETDVLLNLAERSQSLDYCRPEFINEPGIHIVKGRHPVVEQVIDEPFIANDLEAGAEHRLLIITGPNMGGKSTYMRQTALIALLAHIGSFVPAQSCTIGPLDRIFTRVGATDDLSGGRSTFMVEMTETANILHNATPESLVLMDEIGRGTSTFDGLSLAWATAHYIGEQVGAFTLFATHYFELTALADEIPATVNLHLDATEHNGKLVFMHAVKDGPANKSYGLQVAALAGVPGPVIEYARGYLAELEQHADAAAPATTPAPFELTPPESAPDAVRAALEALNPDELTPRQALEALYLLKQKLK